MKLSDEALAALARAIGIDAQEIARRKAFLELGEADVRLLTELHERIQGVRQRFVDEFYAHLLEFDETRRFISDEQSLARLKRAQATYFESLTAGDYGPEYILHHLHVGVTHQRIGLAPKWYIGAYSKYLSGLLRELWRLLHHDPQKFLDTYSALQKILLLDMGLAIDTYIHADRILGLKQYAEDILASLPAGLVVLDNALRVLSVNRSFRELFGLRHGDDVAGRDIEALLPLPGLRERAEGVLVSSTAVHGIEATLDEKHLRLAVTGIRLAEEEEEEEDRLLLVVEDVTGEHALRAQAQAHERRFHDLVEGLDVVVWEAERRGEQIVFTFMSRRAEALLGYPVERWLGHELWLTIVHPDDRHAVLAFYKRVLERERDGADRERLEIEYRARTADGEVIWLHDVVDVGTPAQHAARLRGITMDVTARKAMESRLAHLANYDALTGLPNRYLLHDRLGQALVYARRHGRVVAVLFLDLDRFKVINDSLGHTVGDRLLKAVAERLMGCVREGDTVARHGGDEFVVILGDMARPQDATLVAQNILASFVHSFHLEAPQAGGAQELFATPSIGISLYPGDGEDVDTVVKNADAAMYRSKEGGGNNYHFFTPEMDARAHKRLRLESALNHALAQAQFVLHYQPQVELRTGRVIAVEALLRWRHPEQGLIAPTEFIPLLEETGLIVPVGEWVLREACAQAVAWRAAGLPLLRVAVNLSARQLGHECFADTLASALAGTGLGADGLELEITESLVMQQVETSLETLHRIHARGVRLSMDDFGTGYSSLSHLQLLPIDAVKIDRTFVRDIPDDEDAAAIARAIIALIHSLQLKVIAEGVETKAQYEFLQAHGCEMVQGFYIARPRPADEVIPLLERGRWLPPTGQ